MRGISWGLITHTWDLMGTWNISTLWHSDMGSWKILYQWRFIAGTKEKHLSMEEQSIFDCLRVHSLWLSMFSHKIENSIPLGDSRVRVAIGGYCWQQPFCLHSTAINFHHGKTWIIRPLGKKGQCGIMIIMTSHQLVPEWNILFHWIGFKENRTRKPQKFVPMAPSTCS